MELENPELYRQGVGLLVLNSKDMVLAGLRKHRPGRERNWQVPQGGLDDGEDLLTGLYRELVEETGLTTDDVMLVAVLPVSTAYRWLNPRFNRDDKIGQEHMWVVLRKNTDLLPDLARATQHEFDELRWMTLPRLVRRTPGFRRAIYTAVHQMMGWWMGIAKRRE